MSKNTTIYALIGLAFVLVYGLLDPNDLPFPKCPLRSFTGWLCPGCGSQRAIHQVLHGRFIDAFRLNALFIPALAYALTGYGIAFFFPRRWPNIRLKWFGTQAAWIAVAVILIFWVSRNVV